MIGYCSDWQVKDGIVLGKAIKIAKLVKEEKDIFGSFFAGLSSKDDGLKVIDYLIQNQIFFDPSFIKDEDVDDKTFTHLDKDTLVESLNINTDLNLIYISSETLAEKALCKTVANAISECEHPLKLVLDYTKDDDILSIFAPLKPIVITKMLNDEELVNYLASLAF